MSEGALDAALQKFIAQHIESVEKLEILFFLHNNPDVARSSEDVFRHVQSSLNSVSQKLRLLASAGMAVLHPDGRFQYQPRTEDLALLVSMLQKEFRLRPTKVIEAIFSQKSSDLRAFSDAFRFRKESE